LVLGAAMLLPGSEMEDELMAGSRTAATVVSEPLAGWSTAESISIDASPQDKDAVLVNLVTYQEH
jgi:hypothetical protein